MSLRPIHPGEYLAEDVMAELNLKATDVSKALGVSVEVIEGVIRGEQPVTADLALRISAWLGTSAKIWLDLQTQYDLRIAERDMGEEISRVVTPLPKAELSSVAD
jgi:addiction module HigA family antidote